MLKAAVTLYILIPRHFLLYKGETSPDSILIHHADVRPDSLINKGAAIPFTAHASAPTITMPRVKALTTGSVPSFLDVILNFAESDTSSTLANQDTWPKQLQSRQGGKLVMYGDDTWLKLFPGIFSRMDGTSSFFVSVGSLSSKASNMIPRLVITKLT